MIRIEEQEVLLLDARDIYEGTPNFNINNGESEMKSMAAMGYVAATMGNHDFETVIENFATKLQHDRFQLMMSNYDFTNTPMELKYKSYTIFKKGRLNKSVTAVGVELNGLVSDNFYCNTEYLDPVQKAN